MPEQLLRLARACATKRDEDRIEDIGLYFSAGSSYRYAHKGPVFVIMTPAVHRAYQGVQS